MQGGVGASDEPLCWIEGARSTGEIHDGAVDHEIFVNECNEDGSNEFPEACIDAPGVDRAALRAAIGEAAVAFFRESLSVGAVLPRP